MEMRSLRNMWFSISILSDFNPRVRIGRTPVMCSWRYRQIAEMWRTKWWSYSFLFENRHLNYDRLVKVNNFDSQINFYLISSHITIIHKLTSIADINRIINIYWWIIQSLIFTLANYWLFSFWRAQLLYFYQLSN